MNYPSFTNGFPQRYMLKNAPKNATFVANPTVFGLQPGVKWITPEIYDWNITFERQLRADTVFHASYVGTRGTHLRQDVNVNPASYTAGSTASLQAAAALSAVRCHLSESEHGANGYNGMQFDLEKRAGSGGTGILNQITLLANYTYSKAMDYGLAENGGITDIGSSLGSGMSFYDPRQKAFETGPASYDHGTRSWRRSCGTFPSSTARMAGPQHCWRLAMDRNLLLHHRRSADHSGWNRPIPNRQQSRPRGLHRSRWWVREIAVKRARRVHWCQALLRVARLRRFCKTISRKLRKRRQRNLAWPESLGCGHGPHQELLSRAVPRERQLPVPGRVLQPVQPSTVVRSERELLQRCLRHHPLDDRHQTGNVGTTADYRIIQLALKMNF